MKRNGNFGFNSALLEKVSDLLQYYYYFIPRKIGNSEFLPYFCRGITEAGNSRPNDVSKDLVFLWFDKCCSVCSAK